MKKLLWVGFCFLFLGCASSSPKTDVVLGTNKEYDQKVIVKDLDSQPQPTVSLDPSKIAEGTPSSSSTIQPPLGLEPKQTRELKTKKKKKETALPEDVSTTPSLKHLPEYEGQDGFTGRRPSVDPFHVGEKVTLMMTYFGVSAGDATLEVRPFKEVNGRKAYHFYSKLTSSSVFSMFYKVDDYAEVFLDYDQMVPINFVLSAVETKQLMDIRAFFDWKTMKADFWRKRVTKEDGPKEVKETWDLEPYIQNVYSALQYIRVFPMKVGDTYRYKVIDDKKTWEVSAKILRKEVLKTDAGTFNTTVIEPTVGIGGILKPMGEVLFWLTDDDRKFIVKFEAKIKIGKIIGYLKALDKGAP